jgi:hypothetical protein
VSYWVYFNGRPAFGFNTQGQAVAWIKTQGENWATCPHRPYTAEYHVSYGDCRVYGITF